MSDAAPDLPLATVIVPARNEEAHLGDCLSALAAQDYPRDRLEVLIVEGGSTDATRAVAERFIRSDPRFRLLDNPHGRVAAGLNLGVAQARGEVLLRVDAHTLPAPDYARRCVQALAATGADNVGGPMLPQGETRVGEAVACAMGSRFGVGTARFRFARAVEEVDTVYLGAFPRRVFERVGPFNEELDRNQDYEMNYRIRRAGGHIVVDPRIRSVYRTRRTLADVRLQYADYGYWKAQMLRRHPASLRARQLAAPALVLGLAATALATLLALVAPGVPRLLVWALPALLALYLGVGLAVALRLAARRGWRLLPALLAVFPTLHLSWGCGFLAGLWARPRAEPAR